MHKGTINQKLYYNLFIFNAYISWTGDVTIGQKFRLTRKSIVDTEFL
jgi:hypothetical protein